MHRVRRSRRLPLLVSVLSVTALGAVACGGGSGGSDDQVGANEEQTIVFATQGLGAEGDATKQAIKGFEKEHPNIHVQLLTLSSTSNNAYQQLEQRFVAGSSTPDVVTSDVIWPATFAKAGWLEPLDSYHPDLAGFFPGQVKSGQLDGKTYGIPWFINAEGLYYRTDLMPNPPTTPQQLIAMAQQAMSKDPALKEGLAFEGDKYEGAVTAFIDFLGGFGGRLDTANLDTPQNQQALQFMYDTINKYKIAPEDVTGWQESNVQDAWLSGQAAFAMNWPYLYALSEQKGSTVSGKTGWIPFPSETGSPQAALGGDDLAINANSDHKAAAWEFIQYLTSPQVQIQRATTAGDPPAVQAAYTNQLYAKAPYFKQEKNVFTYATPRPITPAYPQISDQLQAMLSSVLTGQESAADGLSNTATQVKDIAGAGSSG